MAASFAWSVFMLPLHEKYSAGGIGDFFCFLYNGEEFYFEGIKLKRGFWDG